MVFITIDLFYASSYSLKAIRIDIITDVGLTSKEHHIIPETFKSKFRVSVKIVHYIEAIVV